MHSLITTAIANTPLPPKSNMRLCVVTTMKDTKYLNQSKAKIGALYRDIKSLRDEL